MSNPFLATRPSGAASIGGQSSRRAHSTFLIFLCSISFIALLGGWGLLDAGVFSDRIKAAAFVTVKNATSPIITIATTNTIDTERFRFTPGLDQEPSTSSGLYRNSTRFIFGHSTGHAGSTTLHSILQTPSCPWNKNTVAPRDNTKLMVAAFEKYKRSEGAWNGNLSETCDTTVGVVLPMLSNFVQKKRVEANRKRQAKHYPKKIAPQDVTYIDLGHFHNRGRVMECLAYHLREKSTFVRIRRNRYDIAQSFAKELYSPCKNDITRRPTVSICPIPFNERYTGLVNLPVPSEAVWDAMTPFQRFLWGADEIEHRWHVLTETYRVYGASQQSSSVPTFQEVTWSTSQDLKREINQLRLDLGCTPVFEVANAKQHVSHGEKVRNCTHQILEDLKYRQMMNYDEATLRILVSPKFPQRVDSDECVETRQELELAIQQFYASTKSSNNYDHHLVSYDRESWVFPLL